MSASAPRQTGPRNPATKFIKWKGGDEQGWFEYYDKEIQDVNLRNIKVDLSEGFYILDKDLFSITGFIEPTKTNIISNEVRTIDDLLIVKGYTGGKNDASKKTEILLRGTYAELKSTVSESKNYHYTRSIYIMFRGELCHIAMSGAAFASWIKDVESNAGHSNSIIRHVRTEDGKKGNVKYKFPVFEVGEKADEETWDQVVALDANVLQPFLNQYLAAPKDKTTNTETQEQTFDKANWRQFKLSTGSRLCELSSYQIREMSDRMIEAGDVDSVLFDCVSQAIVDYNTAIKQWEMKKDKSGKFLKDYTLQEIKDLLPKIPADHESKLVVEAALEAKTEAETYADDDDQVPF